MTNPLNKGDFKMMQETGDDANIRFVTNDSIITKHSFTSTSKSQLSANKFGIYRLEIFVQKGKDIEKIAKYDDEKEVIIRYNSNFRVVGIFNNFVQLIEI